MPSKHSTYFPSILPHLSSTAVPSDGEGSRRGRQFVFDEENYAGRDLDVTVMNNRIRGRRGNRRAGAYAAGKDSRRASNTTFTEQEEEEENVLDVAVNNRAGRNLDIDVFCNEFVSDVHGGVRMGARNRAGRDNRIRIAQNSLD